MKMESFKNRMVGIYLFILTKVNTSLRKLQRTSFQRDHAGNRTNLYTQRDPFKPPSSHFPKTEHCPLMFGEGWFSGHLYECWKSCRQLSTMAQKYLSKTVDHFLQASVTHRVTQLKSSPDIYLISVQRDQD